jgi:wyosine [tRNA(Phe)-imidazoG37] synthetase (radical SAM superfamily)
MVSQPEKTCSFDCEYCQLGPTRRQTAQRREFVPIARLADELARLPALDLDYVTFSGTAEPTLAANLGEAIVLARERLSAPVAVLTNSSLVSDPAVRAELSLADEVVAKLDAPTEPLLRRVNRPAAGITLHSILDGLRALRREYAGRLALQIMFYRANQCHAEALAGLASELQPEEVQINTPLRPCAVRPLEPKVLAEIKQAFAHLPAISVYETTRPPVEPIDAEETRLRRPVP